MRQMKTAQSHDGVAKIAGLTDGQKGDTGQAGRHGLKNRNGIHQAMADVKLRAAAQRAGQKLRLHAIGIGDEDTDTCRSGGGQPAHEVGSEKPKQETMKGF
jgi:hypothetical protein